ncbi:hypothetical protein J6590_035545 [Homalodisca vitripennis]|nr:hypothetical protein J6590_035545 [Homalodisca vitripennis]
MPLCKRNSAEPPAPRPQELGNGGRAVILGDSPSDHIRPIDGALGLPIEADSGARCYNNGGDLGMIHPKHEKKDEDLDYLYDIVGNTSNVTTHIMEYLSGFILSRANEETQYRNSLISCKNRGGLLQPSEGVVKLCLLCETEVKLRINKGDLTTVKKLEDRMAICFRSGDAVRVFACILPIISGKRLVLEKKVSLYLKLSRLQNLPFLDALKMAATGFNTTDVVGIGVLHLLVLCDRWTHPNRCSLCKQTSSTTLPVSTNISSKKCVYQGPVQ